MWSALRCLRAATVCLLGWLTAFTSLYHVAIISQVTLGCARRFAALCRLLRAWWVDGGQFLGFKLCFVVFLSATVSSTAQASHSWHFLAKFLLFCRKLNDLTYLYFRFEGMAAGSIYCLRAQRHVCINRLCVWLLEFCVYMLLQLKVPPAVKKIHVKRLRLCAVAVSLALPVF